jgi:DNA-binding transcriptional MerR regulator
MTGGSRSGFGARGMSSSRASAANVGIGQVLAQLRPDFPDISPSKIRFLEAEGLITPERAESGYRRFAVADIERLRYILTAQRDEYLPLRVIKERLSAMDSGDPAPAAVMMTRSELLAASGADEETLAELEDFGLVRHARQYGAPELSITRAAAALREYGIQPRHLRAVKAAADREVSLVEQVVAPLARQRASREPALRTGAAVASLIAGLHATLVEGGLADAGLIGDGREDARLAGSGSTGAGLTGTGPASGAPVGGTYHVTAREAPGLRSASGR